MEDSYSDQHNQPGARDAVSDFCRVELCRISDAVEAELRSIRPSGVFSDVATRHLWDEYCWDLQNGPYESEVSSNGSNFGSVSSAIEELVSDTIDAQLASQPRHLIALLSDQANHNSTDDADQPSDGNIWADDISSLVVDELTSRASKRNLDFISPDRFEAIKYEMSLPAVLSMLEDGRQAWEIIWNHFEVITDPLEDLREPAEALLEAFRSFLNEEASGTIWEEFFEQFESDLQPALLKYFLGALADLKADILHCMDS